MTKKNIKLLISVLILGIIQISGSCFPTIQTVFAENQQEENRIEETISNYADTHETITVDPNNPPAGIQKNSLIFARTLPENTAQITSTSSAGSRATRYNLARSVPIGDVGSNLNSFKTRRDSYLEHDRDYPNLHYPEHHILLTNAQFNDTITAKFSRVGYYKGKAVDAQLVFTDFNPQNHQAFTNRTVGISLATNLFRGFVVYGATEFRVAVSFVDSVTKQAVVINDKTSITFNSVDVRESVQIMWQGSTTQYLMKDTLISLDQPPNLGAGQNFNGNVFRWSNATLNKVNANPSLYVDRIGDPTFTRSSVSFDLYPNQTNFFIGTPSGAIWSTFSGASLYNLPEAVTKEVKNSSGANINNQAVTLNQEIRYDVGNKVGVMGEDMMNKYSQFVIKDTLPPEVTYQSAQLVDANGTPLIGSGTITHNATSRQVVFTANANFLQNTIRYAGEKYFLRIKVKVDKPGVSTVIKNKGEIIVDKVSRITNEVTNTLKPDNTITKVVKNVTTNTGYSGNTSAYPGEIVEFKIDVKNTGQTGIANSKLVDTLSTDLEKIQWWKDGVLQSTAWSSPLNLGTQIPTKVFSIRIRGTVKAGIVPNVINNTATHSGTGVTTKSQSATVNILRKGSLKIIKTNEAGNLKLANAVFSVKDAAGKEYLTDATNKTNAAGEINLVNLVPGVYKVQETKAPADYQLVTTSQDGTVVGTKTTTLTFKNKLIPPNMSITKQVRNVTEKIPATGYANSTDVKVGDEVEYEIKIMNALGAGTAQAPSFKDVLPKGLTLTKWTYQVGTGNITDKKLTGWNAATNTLTNSYATKHNPNTLVTIKLTAKVGSSWENKVQTVTNTASVSATNIVTKSASANTVVYVPKQTLTKAANNSGSTVVGTTASPLDWTTVFYYDITYKNDSSKGVTNPRIIDTLPAGIKAELATIQYKLNGATAWTTGTTNLITANKLDTGATFTPAAMAVKPGQTLVIRLKVKAENAAKVQGLTKTNTATATANYSLLAATTTKQAVGTVNASANVLFKKPALAITKTVKNNTEGPNAAYGTTVNAKAGDKVDFQIVISNPNGGFAESPEFKDILPVGLTLDEWFYNGTAKNKTGWDGTSRTITNKYATNHNPNVTVTIRVIATVEATGWDTGQAVTNTASVSASGVAAVKASANVVPFKPSHTITKAAKNAAGVVVGTPTSKLDWPTSFYYELTYTNKSAVGFTNPLIKDSLPADLEATAKKVEYKLNGAATWTTHPTDMISLDNKSLDTSNHFTAIAPGKTLIIRIPVKATSSIVQGTDRKNTVTATATYSILAATTKKNNVGTSSNSATVSFKVPSMTLTKKVRNMTENLPATGYAAAVNGKPGDEVTYEIKITNAATGGTAYAPTFTDVLPASINFTNWLLDGVDKGQKGWNLSTRTLSDHYLGSTANHAPGKTVTILVKGKIANTGVADKQVLTNSASVKGSGFTEQKAEASVTNYLPTYSLKKTSSKATIVPDEEFTYSLTFTNNSTLTSSYISPTITDNLPTGVKAKAQTTDYSLDGGTTFKSMDDKVWSDSFSKIDTSKGINPTIKAGNKLIVRFTVKATLASSTSLVNTGFVNGKFGLSATTTTYGIKEVKDSVTVTYQLVDQLLNVRQVILTPQETLVQPNQGYVELRQQKAAQALTGINQASLSISSTTKDKNVGLTDFTTVKLKLMKENRWLHVTSVVPEYYEYIGSVQSSDATQIATTHVSSKLTAALIELDYNNQNEYWVTIYLKPKLASSENEPRPYSWSHKRNQFGTLKK